jgi:preprotein translocase subunit YajC
MMNLFSDVSLLMGVPGGEAGAAQQGGGISLLVMMGLIIAIFYFLIIRPQNKKQKETQKMLEALKKGDKVVSIGGIHGSIQSIKDDTVVIKIDSDTKMTLSRSAVSNIVEKGKQSKKAEKQVEEVGSEEETEQEDSKE